MHVWRFCARQACLDSGLRGGGDPLVTAMPTKGTLLAASFRVGSGLSALPHCASASSWPLVPGCV